jgi:Ras-related protein Rab-2A
MNKSKNKNIDYQIKSVLIGDSGVGKTCLAKAFCLQKFDKFSEPTIGASYMSRDIELEKGSIRLNIWDTAGQEKYDSLIPMYYRGAQIIFLVYDISERKTLDRAIDWIRKIKSLVSASTTIALIGNKTDLEREISYEEAYDIADKYSMKYYETSAKQMTGITELFIETCEKAYLNEVLKDDIIYNNINIKNSRRNKFCFLF